MPRGVYDRSKMKKEAKSPVEKSVKAVKVVKKGRWAKKGVESPGIETAQVVKAPFDFYTLTNLSGIRTAFTGKDGNTKVIDLIDKIAMTQLSAILESIEPTAKEEVKHEVMKEYAKPAKAAYCAARGTRKRPLIS